MTMSLDFLYLNWLSTAKKKLMKLAITITVIIWSSATVLNNQEDVKLLTVTFSSLSQAGKGTLNPEVKSFLSRSPPEYLSQ